MAKNYKKLNQILANWSITPGRIRMVRKVYKISTKEGTYCLKVFKEKPEKLKFIVSVQDTAKSHGFQQMAEFVPTKNGEYFVVDGEDIWVVSNWVKGREPEYEEINEICCCAEVLAKFHEATQKYKPRIKKGVKNKLGKWDAKLAKKHNELVGYCEKARQTMEFSNFSNMLAEESKWLIEHSKKAINLLKRSKYKQICENESQYPHVCHGDTAARNFMVDDTGDAWLIDFDSMAMDLRVVDLWRLIRRTLRKSTWNFKDAKQVLDAYERISPISPEEYEVLYALLWFPEKQWRLAKKFYDKRDRENLKEHRLYKRMKQNIANHQNKDRFLEMFAKEYGLKEL